MPLPREGGAPPQRASFLMFRGQRRVMMALIGLALLASCVYASAAPLGPWSDGIAAHFGGPQDRADPNTPTATLLDGSCGYGPQDRDAWPNWRVAAISPLSRVAADATHHPLLGCGACLEVQCTGARCPAGSGNASLVVQVADQCVSCPANRFVVPYSVFQQGLADPAAGEVAVRFRQVECQPPGSIVVDVDTYRPIAGGYLRLDLQAVAGSGALAGVELRKTPAAPGGVVSLGGGATWLRLNNTYGAKWEASGLPDPPLDLRITGGDGQVLVASEAVGSPAPAKYPTTVQFRTSDKPGNPEGGPGAAGVQPPTPPHPPCNDSIADALRADPDLSQTASYVEAGGLASALRNASALASPLTFFAPTNAAWAAVPASVGLGDPVVLQKVLLYLVVQGPVSLPSSSTLLPEDKGEVTVPVETLNGAPLTAVATSAGVSLRDSNPATKDANVVRAVRVCQSIVNVVDAVPLPV